MNKEGFCNSCGESPTEYRDFDYNMVEENYGNYPTKMPDNYYDMSGNNLNYNSKVEAAGSPMGLPVGYNDYLHKLPCKSSGYVQPGYKEDYTTELPNAANYWSPSYFQYVSNMPANTRLTVRDPDNPVSFKFGGPQWQNFRC